LDIDFIGQKVNLEVKSRVARWYSFKPKIPIGVNLGGSCNGICWYILCPFGLFYCHLVYFAAIWYSLWYFGIYFPRFGMLHQEKSGNPGEKFIPSDSTLGNNFKFLSNLSKEIERKFFVQF
jgi:hypothetical protein